PAGKYREHRLTRAIQRHIGGRYIALERPHSGSVSGPSAVHISAFNDGDDHRHSSGNSDRDLPVSGSDWRPTGNSGWRPTGNSGWRPTGDSCLSDSDSAWSGERVKSPDIALEFKLSHSVEFNFSDSVGFESGSSDVAMEFPFSNPTAFEFDFPDSVAVELKFPDSFDFTFFDK
ncbi:hypothetical protein AAVH_43204, partial [Aphelenchoides avenae]